MNARHFTGGANLDSARMNVEPFAQPLKQFLEQKKI
jgi:hypothetical protein